MAVPLDYAFADEAFRSEEPDDEFLQAINVDIDDYGRVVELGNIHQRHHDVESEPLLQQNSSHFMPLEGEQDLASDVGFNTEFAAIPPEGLAERLRRVMGRVGRYKLVCQRQRRQLRSDAASIRRLEREVIRLEEEVEAEQMKQDDGIISKLRITGHGQGDGVGGDDNEARRRRDEARRQLFSGVDLLGDDSVMGSQENSGRLRRSVLKIRALVERSLPLQQDLRVVEARFGSSTASFFVFFRWIILNFLFILLLGIGFAITHAMEGSFSWTGFTSFVPTMFVFSSFTISERVAVGFTSLMSLITLLALGLHKWIREDLRAKTLSSFEDEGSQFGRMAFSIWDFNSTSKEEAEDLKYFNGEQLSLLLAEDELAIRKAQRSVAVRAKLWARRLSGILMSVILQAAVSTLIVQLTITSGQLEDTIRSSSMLQGLSPVASSIVPATVSVLNAMQPPIITAISKFEQWDSAGTYIKWMVWRLFISKFLNVMLQAMTLLQLADPYLFLGRTYGISDRSTLSTIRSNTAITFKSERYTCRADQAGVGLFQLVATEFVISKAVELGVVGALYTMASLRGQYFKRPEYEVSKAMARLLYFSQLILMCIPFMPMVTLLVVPMLFIDFKFEKYMLMRWKQKPLKPWSAKDAGAFFVKFYLLSVFMATVVGISVFSNTTYPKSCPLMDQVVASTYDGVDPFCTQLDSAMGLYRSAQDSKARLAALSTGGGEITYWLAKRCPAQCAEVHPDRTGDAAPLCEAQCAQAIGLQLSCSTTVSSYDSATSVFTPANVTRPCDLACGPFQLHKSGYAAFEEFLMQRAGAAVQTIYIGVQRTTYVWVLAGCLFLFACFKWNSLSVIESVAAERQMSLESAVETLERRVRTQAKRLQVLQSQQRHR